MSHLTAQPDQQLQQVEETLAALKDKPGALLPILHSIQDKLGYIPSEAVALIADALNQTRAEIHGVISFYHQFRTTAPGAHQIEICRAEACQSVGSRQLEAHAKAALGVDFHETTADREITLEAVYCLGNCACAPSVRVGDRIHGRMNADKFDQLVDQLKTQTLEVL